MKKLVSIFALSFIFVILTFFFAANSALATNEVNTTAFVTVSSNTFTPNTVNIRTGDTVQWDNAGGFHNVVADDNSFTSGPPSSAPWTYSHTFTAPGTYPYYCSAHGGIGGVGMSGVVIVSTVYEAVLKGANEVPPVSSTALGGVRITDQGGSSLAFKLAVRDIVGATAAHIHCGAAGTNGPVGVTLASGVSFTGSGAFNGTITAPDAGNGCGWSSLADITAAMNTGDTYVNIHTTANPGGELRGQLQIVP